MNFRTTIVLILLLCAALAIVLVDRFSGSKPGDDAALQPDSKGRRLVDYRKDDLGRIVLRNAAGQTLELAQANGKWNLVQPVAWRAETFEADKLADELTSIRSRGGVSLAGDNASAFGIDKPRYTVEVATKDGKSTTLRIGSQQELTEDLYIASGDGKEAWLAGAAGLASRLDQAFEKVVSSLRDPQMVSTSTTDIRQVELGTGDKQIRLHKEGEDWQLVAPVTRPADNAQVSDLLYQVTGLRAAPFLADNSPELKHAGLDKPSVTVWYSTEIPSTQPGAATRQSGNTIAFGQFEDILKKKVYVRSAEGNVAAKVAITTASWDKLAKPEVLDYYDKKVLNIEPSAVKSISIVSDKPAATQPTTRPASRDEIVIERKKESVTLGPVAPPMPETPQTQPATTPSAETQPFTQPVVAATQPTPAAPAATQPALPPSVWTLANKGDAEQAKVETLLNALAPLRADKYIDPSGPATQPSATYTVRIQTESAGGAKATTHELRFTDPGSDKPLVGDYDGLRFEVARDLIGKLEGDWTNKPKAPEPPAPDFGPGGMPPGMPGGFPGGMPGQPMP